MSVPVEEIVIDRLRRWGQDAIRDHATPSLMLAIGHDQHSGEIHVYVPDDPMFDTRTIRQMLKLAQLYLDRVEQSG